MSSLAANASPMRRTAACRRPRSRTATSRRCCACSMRLRRSLAISSSRPASGRTSRIAKMLRWATSAARKPIGARQASTAQTSPKTCSWSVGATPRDAHLAQHGAAGVEDAAADERGRQHGKIAQAELRGAGQQQDAAPVRPRARRRGSRRAGARTSRARGSSPSSRASSSPAATRNGTAPGGTSTSIGISTSCVGSTLPAPTGNSTPARIAYKPTRTAAVARSNPRRGAREQQQAPRGRDEQQREHDLRDELAARQTPRPAVPGLLEETIGRRLAAHVVGCAHSRLVIGHGAQRRRSGR